jgi:hypothetical protein
MDTLVPSTIALVDDALGLVREVLDVSVDVHGNKEAMHEATDLAFLARSQLSQKRERLVVMSPRAAAWELVAECGSAKRRVGTAVESLATAIFGSVVHSRARASLESSLLVRREYAALRLAIVAVRHDGETDVRPLLRSVGTRLAMTVGSHAFPRMRVRDRVELRALQGRIIDWLRRNGDAAEGRRLLGDLRAFAGLLAQVSRREELVRHDTEVLRSLEARLEGAPLDVSMIRDNLLRIEGLDEELDALAHRELDVGALLESVRSVLRRTPGAMPYLSPSPEGPESI